MLLTVPPLAADWQEVADQATAAGVLIALLAAVASTSVLLWQVKLMREGQRFQQQHATSAAQRAEAAAALTEEYTRRVVEALEAMARNGDAAAPHKRVRWALTHFGGDRFLLSNHGELMARDVVVSSHSSLDLLEVTQQDIAPDGAMTFFASPSLATSDYTVTVAWGQDESSDRQTWKYPLPVP